MSKSYGNAISISMTAEETARLIKKSKSDSERMITYDPETRPEISGLLTTAGICTGRDPREIAEEIGMGGAGALKRYVTEAVNGYFAPIRERRAEIERDMGYVADVLHEGKPPRPQDCRGDPRRGPRGHGDGVLGGRPLS